MSEPIAAVRRDTRRARWRADWATAGQRAFLAGCCAVLMTSGVYAAMGFAASPLWREVVRGSAHGAAFDGGVSGGMSRPETGLRRTRDMAEESLSRSPAKAVLAT